MAAAIRNVLLDRDGTIIEDRGYLSDPDGVALIPGAGQALGRLTRTEFRLFCATNQSGIGRGYFGEEDFQAVQTRLADLLRPHGAVLTDTAFCPHGPDDGCACRKPGIGLFAALAGRHGLLPAETAVIGDKASDIGFALALGSPLAILVATGHGAKQAAALGLPDLRGPLLVLSNRKPDWPHVLARDLPAAAAYLLDERSLPATPAP